MRFMLGSSFVAAGGVAVQYGSRKADSDLDIMVVQENAVATPKMAVGRLDLFVVAMSDLVALSELLDPAATEPVLTGDLLLGCPDRWQATTRFCASVRASDAAVSHLRTQSARSVNTAEQWWRRFEISACMTALRWLAQCLAFARSYRLFADYYSRTGGEPITLARLRTQDDGSFWSWYEMTKRSGACEPGAYLRNLQDAKALAEHP
ncbi:MAG: hypothetical protein GY715_11500 [Planctomycetes bacterium]|nr:hypothetical protein [Planctomycetota bacterium]